MSRLTRKGAKLHSPLWLSEYVFLPSRAQAHGKVTVLSLGMGFQSLIMMMQNPLNIFAYLRYFYPILICVRCFSVGSVSGAGDSDSWGLNSALLVQKETTKQGISLQENTVLFKVRNDHRRGNNYVYGADFLEVISMGFLEEANSLLCLKGWVELIRWIKVGRNCVLSMGMKYYGGLDGGGTV